MLYPVVVQSLSCVRFFATSWTAARQTSLSFTISRSLLRLISIELVIPSSHLTLCRPLSPLPSIPPSVGGFSSVAQGVCWESCCASRCLRGVLLLSRHRGRVDSVWQLRVPLALFLSGLSGTYSTCTLPVWIPTSPVLLQQHVLPSPVFSITSHSFLSCSFLSQACVLICKPFLP